MSKIRGVFPLFLATTFGIINGIAIFGPAFKEQALESKGFDSDLTHEARAAELEDVQVGKRVETDAIGVSTSEGLPQHVVNKSPWSSIRFGKQDKADVRDVASKEPKEISERPLDEPKST
ncbi:MAG: hypothetical protein M1836_003349 [Candelina mexicana]|nr:MAG: hypothetical protein M1836_003349 [Candelina mexicana]